MKNRYLTLPQLTAVTEFPAEDSERESLDEAQQIS